MKQPHGWGRGLRSFACGCAVLGALVSQAAEFSVGRVDIRFAEEGWVEETLPDRLEAFGGDRNGALQVQTKRFVYPGKGGKGGVQILVSANSWGMGSGGAAHMRYEIDCKSSGEIYREGNTAASGPFAQCLTVTPLYTSGSVFEALAPQLVERQAEGLEHPPIYTVWSRHAISTGSFVDVRVFLERPLDVEGASVLEMLPVGIPHAHVVWGRQLKDAVKSCVYSLSGRLVMPPVRMSPPATETGNRRVALLSD